MGQKRKNLLIISFDQFRGDWADGKGLQKLKLENLERLANKSLKLERCYTSSPQCVPARFSWITGKEPGKIGVTTNKDISLSKEAPSIIRKLQKKGWLTTIVGKTHWTSHNKPCDLRDTKEIIEGLGFNHVCEVAGPRALARVSCQLTDQWRSKGILEAYKKDMDARYRSTEKRKAWEVRETILPNALYPDLWIEQESLKKIKELPNQKPWLMWVSFVGPHEPFDTPKPWKDISGKNGYKQLPKTRINNNEIERMSNRSNLKKFFEKWRGQATQDEIKAIKKDYSEKLRMLDEITGNILSEIEKREDSQETAILIISDHGEMLGDHGMLYKSTFLESSIRVPCIWYEPGIEAEVYKKPVNLSKMMKKIISNFLDGETDVKEWVKTQRRCIVEFDDELLFIDENHKYCCKINGKRLWLAKIEGGVESMIKENEEVNMVIDKKKLLRMDRWIGKELEKRRKWIIPGYTRD